MNTPLSHMLPWAAGGVGLSLLENKVLGDNLPEPVKKVNMALGATTGALMSDPATRGTALSTLPLKQLGLIGIGSMDRFRRAQQGLVDTNLQTAKTNLHTARMAAMDAGGRKALLAAFLIPALVGGGAAGYAAYNQFKKNHRPSSKFEVVGSKGLPPTHQKVRIDIPPGALPKDFFSSLKGLGDNTRAYSRLEQQGGDQDEAPLTKQIKARGAKKTAAYKKAFVKEAHILPMLGNMLYEGTGLPSLHRAGQDFSRSYINGEQGNHDEAMRYGLGALGGLAGGYVGLKTGLLPVLGKIFGKSRLAGVVSRGEGGALAGGLGRQLREMPTFAKPMFETAFGNELSPRTNASGVLQSAADRLTTRQNMFSKGNMGANWKVGPLDRARNIKFRYDPNRYSWDNPSPSSTASGWGFNKMFTSPAARSVPPPQGLPGQLMNLGRYGVNRGVNAAYRVKQLARRNPMMSLTLGAIPFQGLGVTQDDEKYEQARQSLNGYVPDYAHNRGAGGMPITSALSGLLSGVGGPDVNQGLHDQISQPSHDPYGLGRLAAHAL